MIPVSAPIENGPGAGAKRPRRDRLASARRGKRKQNPVFLDTYAEKLRTPLGRAQRNRTDLDARHQSQADHR